MKLNLNELKGSYDNIIGSSTITNDDGSTVRKRLIMRTLIDLMRGGSVARTKVNFVVQLNYTSLNKATKKSETSSKELPFEKIDEALETFNE